MVDWSDLEKYSKRNEAAEKAKEQALNDFAQQIAKDANDKGYSGTAAQFLKVLKGKATATGTEPKREGHKYLDDHGNLHIRPPRAKGKRWSDKQKQKYSTNYKEKYGNMW